MTFEDTSPLLSEIDVVHNRLNDVYLRFSSTKKNIILAMVSGCGVISYSLITMFTPLIPQIAEDLNSTGAIVNIAVSMSILAASFGTLITASYSTFYGRRPIYLYTLPVFLIGSAGVAGAQSMRSLLFWRFVQCMGASLGPELGAAVIGDIFKLEERGRAMGVFFSTCLIGTAVSPFASGWVTHYYSWRLVHAILGLVGLIIFTTIYFLFPETSQPGERGIDKTKEPNGTHSSRSFTFINPLESLWLLRSPSMPLIGIIVTTSQVSNFVLTTTLPYTIGVRYNITNEALIGACLLPVGLGSLLGAAIVGPISDYTVIKWRRKRKGVWYPEDRLRPALIPCAVIVPIPVLAFGLVNKFIEGNWGLMWSLVCLFFNGVGVDMIYGAYIAYLVDVMHSRSSDILAAHTVLRSILIAISVAASLPMIDAYGVATTYSLCALLIWISSGGLYYFIKCGDKMRAWIDIGFSTVENN